VEPSPALAAFRAGWEALRAGRNADAIAAFDRATDPAVAEDARYWAAIATARAGDQDGAKRRLRAFLVAFPASPHADEARAALRP
jgi:TolA-binding protein